MSSTTHRRRAGLIAGAVLVAGALLGTACGDDDGDLAEPAGAGETTETTETTEAPDRGDPADVVEVTAVDFEFEGLPDEVPVGTKLTLANDAPAELHELVAFRLADDEQRSVHELMSLPEAELGPILSAGPPAMVLMASPGAEQITPVGDGTLTEPGRYLVMCAIPTGIAPDVYLEAVAQSNGEKPEVEGGPPHFVHGMVAELRVV